MKTKKYSLLFRLTSLFISILLATGIVPVIAENSKTILELREEVFSSSLVFLINEPYYYSYGEKTYYDQNNKNYFPDGSGGDVLLSPSTISQILKTKYSYDKKTETFTLTKGNITASIRIGEDAITVNGVQKYISTLSEKTDSKLLLPLVVIAKAFGYNTVTEGELILLSSKIDFEKVENLGAVINSIYDYFSEEIVFKDNFEGNESWSFGNWNAGSSGIEQGIEQVSDAYDGSGVMSLSSVTKGFIGGQAKIIPMSDFKSYDYDITLWAKASDDYVNNTLNVGIFLYKGKSFLNWVPATLTSGELTKEWSRLTYTVHAPSFTSYNVDGLRLTIMTKPVNTKLPVSGKVLIDNVTITAHQMKREVITPMISEKYASWYNVGETVRYRAEYPERLEGFKSIAGTVYDMDNNVKVEKTIPIEEFLQDGFTCQPEEPGYYEIEFTAVAKDGKKHRIINNYTGKSGGKIKEVKIERYGFAYVKKTKPMAERNERIAVSESGRNADAIKTADLVGFASVRMHWIDWGARPMADLSKVKGFNPSQGVFDWEEPDRQFENVKLMNPKRVVANVLNTPKWAVPEEYQSMSSYNTIGLYRYGSLAPANQQYTYDAIYAIVDRYKDMITDFEFWNEPQLRKTVTGDGFWGDTADKFAETAVAASKAVKAVNPEMPVYVSGIAEMSDSLFEELVNNKEFVESFDVLSYHGKIGSTIKYTHFLEDLGVQGKKHAMSEAYYYNYYDSSTKEIDYYENNIVAALSYLQTFKYDLQINAHYAMFGGNDYYKEAVNGTPGFGIFEDYPNIEPRMGAVVLHNLFDLIDADCSHKGEYVFDDKKTACIALNNGGKTLLALWSTSKSEAAQLPAEVKNCIGENTKIIGFEGESLTELTELQPKKVYYLTDLNEAEFDKITPQPDSIFYRGGHMPYYTLGKIEVEPIDFENTDLVWEYNYPDKPFDEKTFKLRDDVVWSDSNWKWVSTMSGAQKPENLSARHAIHIDEDGLYMAIDVTDDNVYEADNGAIDAGLYNFDSVQFAFDTVGRSLGSERVECRVGRRAAGAEIYKESAPDVAAQLPENWTAAGKFMPEKYIKITKTDKGLLYLIFVPQSELYSYKYPGDMEYVRLSILVNNNDGNGRTGYLEWGSGIGASKSPKQYAVLRFAEDSK